MSNLITNYIARRHFANAFTALYFAGRHHRALRWHHRHILHHEIFRANMRQAAALQRDGFLL